MSHTTGDVRILRQLADDPSPLTSSVALPDGSAGTLRPLSPEDVEALAHFYDSLSPESRARYSVSTAGDELAREQCAAIGRFDKLRLVLFASGGGLIGLFEFSLDLTSSDVRRFHGHGYLLTPSVDIRYGLCLLDRFQGLGIASAAQPFVVDAARYLGAERLILWGGVHATNQPALSFYSRSGFVEVGRFVDPRGTACIDMICEL